MLGIYPIREESPQSLMAKPYDADDKEVPDDIARDPSKAA